MAKRKTLDEKIAEDLAKLNEENIANNCMPEIHADTIQEVKELVEGVDFTVDNTPNLSINLVNLPQQEVNIWADLTIPDSEPKENENAAELIHDDFSSVSLEDLEDPIDESPKPTTYKINENKDTGLNAIVTAPIQKTKPQSKYAVRGIYCLNGKIRRN